MMTLKEYLTPNTAVREPELSPEWWTPPEKSRGLRKFKLTSRASSRGISIIDRRCVKHESRGERKATMIVRARPDTLKVIEQSPRIEYVDADGVVHEHTFDLHVFRTDGSKAAIDVKPAAKVKSSGIRQLHTLLAGQLSPRTADELVVMTEKMYTRADLYNAELMHSLRRQHFPDDDETILRLVRRMKGPSPIADLLKRSKLAGYGFNAVVRAIADGHLRMIERRRIEYPAIVAPAIAN